MAQLREAQAQLAKDEAQKVRVGQDLQRYGALVARDFVSKQQYQQAQADEQGINAGIAADQAAMDESRSAGLLLHDNGTDRRADRPDHLKPGNVVRAADTAPLFTIDQITRSRCSSPCREPASDEVPVPQRRPGRWWSRRRPGRQGRPVKGSLAFFDNAIDPSSGTITLIALLPNADERLWPGQFVDVTLVLRVNEHAMHSSRRRRLRSAGRQPTSSSSTRTEMASADRSPAQTVDGRPSSPRA